MKLAHSYSSIKMYDNCPLRYNYQRIKKAVVEQGSEATLHGERIHKFLEERLKTNTDLPQEAVHYEPMVKAVLAGVGSGSLHIEQEMTLTEKLTPTGWWDADAWLRSKLDILILRGRKATVLDWKTGKRRPDFDQLELFALQVFAHHPNIEEVSSGFVWLKDNAMDRETYSRSDAADLWDKLLQRITRIEKSLEHDNWPAKPSGLCRFCPARHLCQFA